jgi:hypothetical protein
MDAQQDSWLKVTRQRWKALPFSMLLGISAITLLSYFVSIQGEGDYAKDVADFKMLCEAIISAVAAFAWFFMAIRCPACGGRPVWFFVRNKSAGAWLFDLVTTRVCPLCGDGGEEKR